MIYRTTYSLCIYKGMERNCNVVFSVIVLHNFPVLASCVIISQTLVISCVEVYVLMCLTWFCTPTSDIAPTPISLCCLLTCPVHLSLCLPFRSCQLVLLRFV